VNYDFHDNLTPAKMDAILDDYAAGRGHNQPVDKLDDEADGKEAQ
jgi:hypothetical protein